ncbi:MAG: recombinase family protein [Oscillospiraceae bacterium]|jgi:DNA invertase Pin-like site-specific DNA recombinase|nr:recombinase family protein [Oscillospiraceae bacterium]
MNKQTAIYCRTAEPDPGGITRQRAALVHLARERGFSNVAVYEDDGFSARDCGRPAFARLNQDIREGKIARVLVTSVTLLERNIIEVLRWARESGVEIHPLRRC